MDINIIKNSKNEIEFEMLEKNPTLPEVLVHYLNQREEVEFAGYDWAHPFIAFPKVVLKTHSDTKASEVLFETIEKIRKEMSSLKEALKKVE